MFRPGFWEPGLCPFPSRGAGIPEQTPQDGLSWGAWQLRVCILPLLVPCERRPGSGGGAAEPLVPVRCCSITAWLETHPTRTPRLCILPAGPQGTRPGETGGGGLAQSSRRDSRTLPSPHRARPMPAALGAACTLSPPQGQIHTRPSHQVFLWGTPPSFPDFLYGKPPRPPNSWHTDFCCVCIGTPHPNDFAPVPMPSLAGVGAQPLLLGDAPWGSVTDPCPQPPAPGNLPKAQIPE